MRSLQQKFTVAYEYPVHFTTSAFAADNRVLVDTLLSAGPGPHRLLCVLDEGVLLSCARILEQIEAYARQHRETIKMVCSPLVLSGGEEVKNDKDGYLTIEAAIQELGICRQSFVLAIGGGALLDLAGFAAGTAHRGVRLIRMPTTVLSQDDSGVGVKNSINAFGKKNFLGTFVPPFAVINDSAFLHGLSQRDWIGGTAEAVKVALLKDPCFFRAIEQSADELALRGEAAMQQLIHHSAELHLQHIGLGGDPFETSSSRPLDFGHWSAHKLEQLTNFELRHGEAVAIGIALDSTYSYLDGLLAHGDWQRILMLLARLGFALSIPNTVRKLGPMEEADSLLHGLVEFREHLGGELTITLLRGIGEPMEVHSMDEELVISAVRAVEEWSYAMQLSTV